MPYVQRDAQGKVCSLHRDATNGAESYLPAHHADVTEFLGLNATDPAQFPDMDAELVRVLEDLIDALILKNVIRLTDLPSEAQQKIFARKHLREALRDDGLSLFPDDDGLI